MVHRRQWRHLKRRNRRPALLLKYRETRFAVMDGMVIDLCLQLDDDYLNSLEKSIVTHVIGWILIHLIRLLRCQGRHLAMTKADCSMARSRAHPYARFNRPLASPFIRELQLHGLPLASPFHEKQFDLPLPSPVPSGEKLSIRIPVVRECEW